MKPEPVLLRGVTDGTELARRVLHTRLREVRSLAGGLERRDQRGLHAFRIACKRFRYALERFNELETPLESPAKSFALLQDALGEAHDRDVLLSILPAAMAQTEHRIRTEREAYVDRAAVLWAQARELLLYCPLISFEEASNHSSESFGPDGAKNKA
ncbi:MAG: CHAD domain-containing protein [Candidatus Cybelea sp.]